LIVDGHASHIAYLVIDYARTQDIHMICLPSKSTHLLQPLDVGCFGILQKTYVLAIPLSMDSTESTCCPRQVRLSRTVISSTR